MVSWPIKASLELGVLSLAALLWLSQTTISLEYWWQLGSIWLALVVIVVVMTRYRLPAAALVNASVLLVIGWLFMLRIDAQLGWEHWRGIMLGLLTFVISLRFDWGNFRFKYLAGASVLLLLLLTVLFGESSGGAKAWLRIGGLRFQPVEIARIGLLLFTAVYFDDYRALLFNRTRPQLKHWVPVLILLCVLFLFLTVQRDLGPALLFFLTFVSLVFYCDFNWLTILIVMTAAAGSASVAWLGFDHVQQRIQIWLNPWAEPTGLGYQIVQGLFAIHNGGLFGRGLGFGLGINIPAVHTDYVLALVCEELGLVGATAVFAFYLVLLFFGLKTAIGLKGKGQILAVGIVTLWGYQVFLVAGGILKVVPLTGMTLPFVSYGTTSIIANMCLLGILTRLAVPAEAGASSRQEGRKFKRFFGLVIIMFAILWGAIVYWQLIRADLADSPHNPRVMLLYRSKRGSVYDRNGQLLASSDLEAGQYIRRYHGHPSLSHVIGYFHPRYGMTGLEAEYNLQLAKEKDLYLTIDAKLQAAIDQYMHSYQGAVIVMKSNTGEILALYSTPYVDPNYLDHFWEQYQKDQNSPFHNRAVNGVYPPGSTIKPLLLAAAYQTGAAASETSWLDEGFVFFADRVIQNFQGQAFGTISTQEALALSSNVVFAQLAVRLKDDGLRYLHDFGLGEAPGQLPVPGLSEFGWAQLGIGQGEVLVTPLQMAAAISTIANNGMRMEPYLVRTVSGNWLTRLSSGPKAVSQVITQRTAVQVRRGMVEVVANGTGQAAQLPGVAVAGKTGTAENAQGRDHSWFVGFAPAENPRIAVAVVVEHGGYGGGAAAQIGRQVISEALDRS